MHLTRINNGKKQSQKYCYAYLNQNCPIKGDHDGVMHPNKEGIEILKEILANQSCNKGENCFNVDCPYSHPIKKRIKQVITSSSSKAESAWIKPLRSNPQSPKGGDNQKQNNSENLDKMYEKEIFRSSVLKTALNLEQELAGHFYGEKYWKIMEICLNDLVTKVKLPKEILDFVESSKNADEKVTDLNAMAKFFLVNSKRKISNLFDIRDQDTNDFCQLFDLIKQISGQLNLKYIWIITDKVENNMDIYKPFIESKLDFMASDNDKVNAFWVKI